MEENVIKNDENLDAIKDQATPPGGKDKDADSNKDKNADSKDSNKDNGTDSESVTLTKAELDKKIQSAEDKLRTSYSKKIKELEGKITELSPVKKTETELELEKRLEDLEKSQREVNAQKAYLSLQDTLQGKGISKDIAAYLKEGIDIEEFATLCSNILNQNVKSKGYVPDGHNSGDKISVEDFKAMKYSEKEKIMRESPELYKRLMAKIKK